MNPDTAPKRILIAGIGNIFLGDDAFGSEVARRLTAQPWPSGVRVIDFGIRGIDLIYALLDDYEIVVLIDATARGARPGTLYLIEPELTSSDQPASTMVSGHALDPFTVLQAARSQGASWQQLFLIGCEPAELGGDEGHLGLSDVVQASLQAACEMVEELVERFAGQPQ